MNDDTRQQPTLPPSKYEMNLAEFPITVLSKHRHADLKVIECNDFIRGKDGALMPRLWRVSPSSLYGFGSTQINATLFALFQVWREQGFSSPAIRFGSVYNLIKLLGLKHESSAYERIRRDLNALVGITVEAKNAFWDNELKAYVDATFHLFDSVHFYHDNKKQQQQSLPFAHIVASNTMYGSVLANALTSLNVDSAQYATLTPTEQRLAAYLAKMLYAQTEHRRDIEGLAQQMPIYAKRYKDKKKMLSKAAEGLLQKGYPHLASYRFEPKRNGNGDNVIFSRIPRDPLPPPAATPHRRPRLSADDKGEKELLIQDLVDFSGHEQSRPFYARAVYALDLHTIYRAISETKDYYLQGSIKKSKAQVLNHILQRLSREQGITLTHDDR